MSDYQKIKRQMRIQSIMIFLLSMTCIYLFYRTYSAKKEDSVSNDILKTHGIVILDENDKERILIGAPIPTSKNRIRDDYEKVEQAYGDWFPPEANFMSVFKNQVNSSTNGILFLDENGYDKMVMGDPVPDLFMGKRIGPSTGIIINDSVGVERSGYGLIRFPDRYRVTLGFDREDGVEGMIFGLDDNGEVELSLRSNDLNESITIGGNKRLEGFDIHYQNRKDSITDKIGFDKHSNTVSSSDQ